MKPPIIIGFNPNEVGRVSFPAEVRTSDGFSFREIKFKLDIKAVQLRN